MVVVTAKEALLWTDGRYFLQAEKELGREWRLMRAGLPSTPEVPAYLKDTLPAASRVGIDPQVRVCVWPAHSREVWNVYAPNCAQGRTKGAPSCVTLTAC
jgi:hypothetical protein